MPAGVSKMDTAGVPKAFAGNRMRSMPGEYGNKRANPMRPDRRYMCQTGAGGVRQLLKGSIVAGKSRHVPITEPLRT